MIYVTSDLHGLPLSKLKELLNKVNFGENDWLYILGDVIDRQNDGGVEILKWLLEQSNVQLILGNHEAMLLSCDFVFEEITEESVKNFGSAITAIPSRDTICMVEEDKILGYVGKTGLYQVQTPQAFNVKDIKKAYEKAGKEIFNDDGEVYLEYISPPHLVMGEKDNLKLTYQDDFEVFNNLGVLRVGVGFDCHKLVENRKLILGGIIIPHDKGLLGHSDADVLTHAIMDAILSGASLRDIGFYFPDKDPKYKDANSILLLKEVLKMLDDNGLKVKSLSATIMAEKPKLLNHIPNIVDNLSKVIGISTDNIGILATTLEGLGFVGREEGICAQASAVLIEK